MTHDYYRASSRHSQARHAALAAVSCRQETLKDALLVVQATLSRAPAGPSRRVAAMLMAYCWKRFSRPKQEASPVVRCKRPGKDYWSCLKVAVKVDPNNSHLAPESPRRDRMHPAPCHMLELNII